LLREHPADHFKYCPECESYFDFYVYDFSLEASGHDKCKGVRTVTSEEHVDLIKVCLDVGCIDGDTWQWNIVEAKT
tara:strand:+ start:82 stop:309 length:228 start_codon:yes stop_codon:yes gene_type:complete